MTSNQDLTQRAATLTAFLHSLAAGIAAGTALESFSAGLAVYAGLQALIVGVKGRSR